MTKPRAYTTNEVRQMFLEQLYQIKEFWEKESRHTEIKDKLEGLVFSILTLIDGDNISFPPFHIIANPHPEDKEYHNKNNKNWIENNTNITENTTLHNQWLNLINENNDTLNANETVTIIDPNKEINDKPNQTKINLDLKENTFELIEILNKLDTIRTKE